MAHQTPAGDVATRSDSEADAGLDVLKLVTNDESQFYQEQVAVLEAAGVDTTTLAVPGEHDYAGDGDEANRSILDYARFYPSVLRRSFEDYDLIHANYGLTAPAAIAQPNLPVVLSLWGSDLMGEYGAVSAWCARRCDAVIVMSQDMADRLDRDCHVIPHGIDLEQFRPIDRREARRELGWDREAHHVLFPYPPGRDVKNFPRARRVVEGVRERLDRPVELQVASGVAHERMPYYMNAADCVLVTSRHEGSPNTVKEALACNVPIVSTDVGDVRERLADVEPSGIATTDAGLVDATAAILDRGDRSDGREAVRHLGTDRMGERIRSVYREVLAD